MLTNYIYVESIHQCIAFCPFAILANHPHWLDAEAMPFPVMFRGKIMFLVNPTGRGKKRAFLSHWSPPIKFITIRSMMPQELIDYVNEGSLVGRHFSHHYYTQHIPYSPYSMFSIIPPGTYDIKEEYKWYYRDEWGHRVWLLQLFVQPDRLKLVYRGYGVDMGKPFSDSIKPEVKEKERVVYDITIPSADEVFSEIAKSELEPNYLCAECWKARLGENPPPTCAKWPHVMPLF